ncbi:MAG: adenosylcobinamide-phosphate synthase CbiB [Lachnospiraceae bacterium]|nr:adenosylcobinamide-phosphate synthase CbiB [Lachnospiraceae bacterium]
MPVLADKITIAVLLGFLLDLLLGDPQWMYHPVRLIGHLIAHAEAFLRRVFPETEKAERRAGICLILIVCGAAGLASFLIVRISDLLHPAAGIAARTVQCYFLFAARSLRDESMKVYVPLSQGDIPASRQAVSMIVGRDTQKLTAEGIAKAAVETIAENTSDGVIAPMLYMVLGGPVLGWLYKAVNTMDSMVGYKNDRYLYFGRYPAKLDDILNLLPSRLSALFMIAACVPAGLDAPQALRVFRRDRYNHASPNSAQTEAVMAGALGVQLAGDAWYFGKLYPKKTIGDPERAVVPEDIRRANRLMYMTSFAALACFLVLRCCVLAALP